jgi:hypothetical protein
MEPWIERLVQIGKSLDADYAALRAQVERPLLKNARMETGDFNAPAASQFAPRTEAASLSILVPYTLRDNQQNPSLFRLLPLDIMKATAAEPSGSINP